MPTFTHIFVPKGHHDQHFLADKRVMHRIIEYADLKKTDTVLEIGAGDGGLTRELSKYAGHVVAVESDNILAEILKEEFESTNVDIIHADALKLEFPAFNKVISNLPYSISSEITFKLLSYDFEFAILMYQKEFADRMVAKTGIKDYSRLTVNVGYMADCEILETVPKGAFRPPPEVKSAIIRLVPRPPVYPALNEKLFKQIVDMAFTMRRKKMKNCLRRICTDMDALPADLLDKRPEQLEIKDFVNLSNIIDTLK